MRPSPQRHALAVLRAIAGLTQKEMAQLAECSTPTIQAVELGKLKLSHDLGMRICLKTGVDPDWLLGNQLDKQPTSSEGEPYTRQTFEEQQAFLFAPDCTQERATMQLLDAWNLFGQHVQMVASLMSYAYPKHQLPIIAYKLHSALSRLLHDLVKPPEEGAKMLKNAFAAKRDADRFHSVAEAVRNYFEETHAEYLRRHKALKKPVLPQLAKSPTKRPAPRKR